MRSAAKVAVIGSTIATKLFPTGSALGQTISVDGSPFTVVGILASQSDVGIQDANSVVVAPISRVQRSYTGFGAISTHDRGGDQLGPTSPPPRARSR